MPVDANGTAAPQQAGKSQADLELYVKNLDDKRQQCKILGPFSLCEDEKVLCYIEKKIEAEKDNPLWNLIIIAARSKGKLRSDEGVADKNSPESAIVELLLRDENSGPSVPCSPRRYSSKVEQGK